MSNAATAKTAAELFLDVSRAIQKHETHRRIEVRKLDGPLDKLKAFRDALLATEDNPMGLPISISPEVQAILDNPPSESGVL